VSPVPEPLLPPTVALLRGFVFDEPGAPVQPHAPSGKDEDVLLREGFRIGPLRLAIRYEDGNELTQLPPVHALPRAPAWFRGMANLHGALVPVFDGACLFGVRGDAEAKPMLLVVGHGDDRAGLVIDGLPVRLRLRGAERVEQAAIPPALAGFVAATYWSEDHDWLDLDVAALLQGVVEQIASETGAEK